MKRLVKYIVGGVIAASLGWVLGGVLAMAALIIGLRAIDKGYNSEMYDR